MTDNTTAALWMQHHHRMDEMQQHFRTEMTACIDQIVRLERQLSDTQTRLDSLQKIVIENHERRIGKLDGHEGKDYIPREQRGGLFQSLMSAAEAERARQSPGFVDPTFPIPEMPHEHTDIHADEQKVAT